MGEGAEGGREMGGQNLTTWQSTCLNFPLETTLSPDATLTVTAAARSPEAGAGLRMGLSLSRMIYENVDL